MLKHIVLGIAGNGIAIYVAQRLVPGFQLTGDWWNYLLASLLLVALNWTIKPLLKLISFPLIILTLGLFSIVINALMLIILDRAFAFITIADKPALLWATIIVSLVNLVISRKL